MTMDHFIQNFCARKKKSWESIRASMRSSEKVFVRASRSLIRLHKAKNRFPEKTHFISIKVLGSPVKSCAISRASAEFRSTTRDLKVSSRSIKRSPARGRKQNSAGDLLML